MVEVSVEAEAEAGAVVEVDLVIGNRFKLAFNYRKDVYYAKR